METTINFLERLEAKHDGCSDYRAAKLLGISATTISTWRRGIGGMGDKTAVKMAELLGEHPAYVMACIHAEKDDTPQTHKVWEQVAAQYAATFVFVFIGFLGATPPF